MKRIVFGAVFVVLFIVQLMLVNKHPSLLLYSLLLLTSLVMVVFSLGWSESIRGRFAFSGENRSVYSFDIPMMVLLGIVAVFIFIGIAAKGIIPAPMQFMLIALGFSLFFMKKESLPEDSVKVSERQEGVYSIYMLIVLFVVAAFTRFYMIGQAFPGTNGDEMLFGEKGIVIAKGDHPFTVFMAESDHQMGGPAYFMVGWLMKIMGSSLVSLRVFPALGAIVSIACFYMFLRLFFSWRIAGLAALVFAFDHVFVHVTRWMHIFPLTPIFLWGGMAALVIAFRKRSYAAFVIGGAMAGWSLYFYNSNKFIPIIFALYMVYEIVYESLSEKKFDIKRYGIYIAAFGAGLLVTGTPLFNYILHNTKTYFMHISAVKPKSIDVLKMLGIYLPMFTVKGTHNAWLNFMSRPLFSVIPSALFLMGVGIAFANIKKRLSVIAILLFSVGLIPAIMSDYWAHPNTQRGIITYTAGFLFIAFAVDFLMRVGKGLQGKVIRFSVIGLILVSSAVEFNTYFNTMQQDYPMKMSWSYMEREICNIADKNYGKNDVYIGRYQWGGMSGSRPFEGHQLYFARGNYPGILTVNQHSFDSVLMFPYKGKDSKRGAVIIMSSFFENGIEMMKKRFPNVDVEVVESGFRPARPNMGEADFYVHLPDWYNRKIDFVIFRIPAEDIISSAGLRLSGDEKTIYDFASDSTPVMSPGKLQGSYRAFQDGVYKFELSGFDAPVFYINGRKYSSINGIKLSSGIYPVTIKVNSITGKERVMVSVDNAPFKNVEFGDFIKERREHGLRGKYYYSKAKKESEVLREDIVPTVMNKWYINSIKGRKWFGFTDSMIVEYTGMINITQPGEYRFGSNMPGGDCMVYIDGIKVLESYENTSLRRKSYTFNAIDLTEGKHKIKVVLTPFSPGNWSLLNITMPDGKKIQPIPEEMLYY